MADEKYGIKATKEMVEFLVAVVQGVVDSFADGRLDIWDVPRFFKAIGKAIPAIQHVGELCKELRDLSPEEIEEIKPLVRLDLKLPLPMADTLLKQVINATIETLKIIPLVRGLQETKK